METQSRGLEKTGSQGWRPRLQDQMCVQVVVARRSKKVGTLPCSQSQEIVLYRPLVPCGRLQMSSKSKGPGKRRKEGALSPRPKDKADRRTWVFWTTAFWGRGTGRAGLPWWQTYRRAGNDQGKEGAPAGVNPAAYRGEKTMRPEPVAEQGVPVTSRATGLGRWQNARPQQPSSLTRACRCLFFQYHSYWITLFYHFKLKSQEQCKEYPLPRFSNWFTFGLFVILLFSLSPYVRVCHIHVHICIFLPDPSKC